MACIATSYSAAVSQWLYITICNRSVVTHKEMCRAGRADPRTRALGGCLHLEDSLFSCSLISVLWSSGSLVLWFSGSAKVWAKHPLYTPGASHGWV